MLRPIMLRQYLEILSSLGFDEKDILAGTRIDPATIEEPGYLVDFGQYLAVFENAARFKHVSGLGLELGLRSGLMDVRILGHATLACRSVRQSMEKLWAGYGAVLGMMSSPRFWDDARNAVSVEFAVPLMSDGAYRLCVEDALCKISNIGAAVTGNRVAFEKISLSYPAPEYGNRYREIFRCPVAFNAPRTRVVLKREWAERPLPTHDDALLNAYLDNLSRLDQRVKRSSTIVDRVKERLLRNEDPFLPTQTEVARDIGLTERTFCRALQRHGSNYRDLVEGVRIERALASLESGEDDAKELSFRAGYRNVSAFRRAFKKWTGQSVREYRRNANHGQHPPLTARGN